MSATFPPSLYVRLFGPPRIERGGQTTHLTSLREITVLALLGLGHAGQTRAQLLALLWPDSAPLAARKNLRNTLWALRRVLGEDAITTRGEHLALAEDVWVDAREFGAVACLLRRDGDAAPCGVAWNGPRNLEQVLTQTLGLLELSTGPFLEGAAAPEDDELGRWLQAQRDHLDHLHVEALTQTARCAAAQGAWTQVLSLAGRALARDPLIEPLHALLMQAHVQLGQRAEALRQFTRLQDTLARELGLAPSHALVTLHRQIVAGAPETMTADTAQPDFSELINLLPLDSSQRFFGRERERAELTRLLRGRPRLLGIYGRGGVGKTALLCRTLLDLQGGPEPFPYTGTVSLGPSTTGVDWTRIVGDLALLLPEDRRDALRRDTCGPGRTPRQNAHALLGHLQGGHYLLLLDQAERLIDPLSGEVIDRDLRALLATVLCQGGPLTVVHTTRAPGAIPTAWLSWERSVHLTHGLDMAEAAALLRACDPDGRAGLRGASDDQLTPITHATAGLPRALEAVAGLLLERPLLSLRDLCAAPERLLGEATGLVVGRVLEQLPPELLRVLEALSLFAGPVPRAALAFVLRPFLAENTLDALLERLIRSHLVRYEPGAATLTLHAIDRDYAYQRIPAHPCGEGVADSDYCRPTLHRLAAAYHRSSTAGTDPVTPADAEHRLREFGHLLAARDGDQAAAVLLALGPTLTQWGQVPLLVRLHSALRGHVTGDALARDHLLAQGEALSALGRAADAAVPLREAQALFGRNRDAQGEPWTAGWDWPPLMPGLSRSNGQTADAAPGSARSWG